MIKATFSAGVEALTVHGLHQWDYGQTLEITHPDLPAVLEVHFAAVGAQDAIVRVVSSSAGVVEAPIPDELLEQSRPVLAWVYVVGETSGETMLTVTMPIQTRARPTAAGPIPAPLQDQYTEALAAINATRAGLTSGDLPVAKALEADHATAADSATTATKAEQDGNGSNIAETYVKKGLGLLPVTDRNSFPGIAGWVHLFSLTTETNGVPYSNTVLCEAPDGDKCASAVFGTTYKDGAEYLIGMNITGSIIVLYAKNLDGDGVWDIQNDATVSLSYCPLFGLPVG